MKRNYAATCLRALLPLLPLLLLLATARAQAPAWQMAIALSSTQDIHPDVLVAASAADANGNVYIAGSFVGRAMFGNIARTSVGLRDAFVAKWNGTSNRFEWVEQAGGSYSDAISSIAVVGTSIYVGGSFDSGTATFGNTTLTNVMGGSIIKDAFVAKLVDYGNHAAFAWALSGGGGGSEEVHGIAVHNNQVYVIGTFGSLSGILAVFGQIVLPKTEYSDVFVAKITDAGTTASFTWALKVGGINNDEGSAIAVSGTSVYVAGHFQGPSIAFGANTLVNTGDLASTDVFVAKLEDVGSTANFGWAQKAGGRGYEGVTALVASSTALYVAGYFGSAAATFGSTVLPNNDPSGYGDDIYVAKLIDAGSKGSFSWAQRAGGASSDRVNALVAAGTDLYLTGVFRGAAAGFGSTTLASTGDAEVWVAKLLDAGSSGDFAWAQQAGGSEYDVACAIAVSGEQVYVGGYTTSNYASFGSTTLVSNATGPGGPNSAVGFLASLTDPRPTTPTSSTLASIAPWPNPAHGRATIQVPPNLEAPTATLTILNALGRALRTQTAPTNAPAELDLTGLPAGIYTLRVTAGGSTATRQLVVE